MDDAWEDEQDVSTSSVVNRESRIRYERLFQQGFRSGIDDGMEEQMQDGFNDGFRVGVAVGKRLGYVEGALKVAAKTSPEDAEAASSVRTALKATGYAEAKEICMKRIVSSSEPDPPTTPPIGSNSALTSAEALCLQLGYPKWCVPMPHGPSITGGCEATAQCEVPKPHAASVHAPVLPGLLNPWPTWCSLDVDVTPVHCATASSCSWLTAWFEAFFAMQELVAADRGR